MIQKLFLAFLLLPTAVIGQQTPSAPDIAHGTLHHETFPTKHVKGLPGDVGSYVVYTPAHYDPQRKPGYPVLYLLHGWGDNADAWVKKGHADLALDRLIATGKAKPMIVVMPLSYGDMSFLSNGFEVWRDEDQISRNVNLFSEALLGEVMPRVEKAYDVAQDREHRAIAGLSMGGQEALTIGLRHPELFASVGGFSAAMFPVTGQDLTALDPAKEDLRLLWVACGTDDDLLSINQIFARHMKESGLPVTLVETPGGHEWAVWRDNLRHFAPLLFQEKDAVPSGNASAENRSGANP